MWISHNIPDTELSLALVHLPSYAKVKMCPLEHSGTALFPVT